MKLVLVVGPHRCTPSGGSPNSPPLGVINGEFRKDMTSCSPAELTSAFHRET